MSLPWVRFFPSDWLAGTRGMSAAETGVYISLIAMMYERGEPLAEDHPRLARLCGASNSGFAKALGSLLEQKKIVRKDGGLWNDRVGREQVYLSEKSAVGKHAANSRWQKTQQKQEPTNADAMPAHSEGIANQKPDTRSQKEKKKSIGLSPEFERFWKVYPGRKGANPRAAASLKFVTAVRNGTDPETIISAAERYALAENELGHWGTPFIAQAVTWLGQRRWEDYPPQQQPPPTAARSPEDEAKAKRYERWLQEANGKDRESGSGEVLRGRNGLHPPEHEAGERREGEPGEGDNPKGPSLAGVADLFRGSPRLRAGGGEDGPEAANPVANGSLRAAGEFRPELFAAGASGGVPRRSTH